MAEAEVDDVPLRDIGEPSWMPPLEQLSAPEVANGPQMKKVTEPVGVPVPDVSDTTAVSVTAPEPGATVPVLLAVVTS